MSHFIKVHLIIGLFVMLSSGSVFAIENKGGFRTTKLGLLQEIYSGTTNRSFSQGSDGLGLELSLDDGNTIFRYFFKSRFTYSSGIQNFITSGTVFNSGYKYLQFAPEFGASFFPVPRRTQGVNVYLWGVAAMSYNNLELKNLPAATNLKSRDQSFGYGYGAGVGFEYVLAPGKNLSYYLIYGEIGFREERTNLVNYDQFEVSGLTYSIGIGF